MDNSLFSALQALIDFRSFSNLWYWIALAVMWSTLSHWVFGVPYDLIGRARRGQDIAMQHVKLLSHVQAHRVLYIMERGGPWIVGSTAFLLTILVISGFLYAVEFCQALFLVSFPLTIVSTISLAGARKIERLNGKELLTYLTWHRFKIQIVGMVSIFITGMWGMWTNINVNVLGG